MSVKAALHLQPWEPLPAEIYDDEMDSEGGRLLKRVVAASVSKYHPVPMVAPAVNAGFPETYELVRRARHRFKARPLRN